MVNTERCIHCGATLWARKGDQPFGHSFTCLLHPDNIARRAAELSEQLDVRPRCDEPPQRKRWLNSAGHVVEETAQAYYERTGDMEPWLTPSPDIADAMAYAFHRRDEPMRSHPDVTQAADKRALIRACLWFMFGFCNGIAVMIIIHNW